MEAILGAADLSAEVAERYGWINRALPDAELDAFVATLARRIASFPAEAVRSTKSPESFACPSWPRGEETASTLPGRS
jgi:enoyl-CoA hydratase/carnithine racemase